MRTTPFDDSLQFLIGNTPDHHSLGPAAPLLMLFYAALLLGSLALAGVTLARDPSQRNGRTAAIWLCRVLIGTMWFQGSLWKLPLPISGGFQVPGPGSSPSTPPIPGTPPWCATCCCRTSACSTPPFT